MTRRARLDAELVRRGLARSRGEAAELVAAGRVRLAGLVAHKPATGVDPDTPVLVADDRTDERYASRGAGKLIGALETWTDLEIADRRCLDAGASTGGFTDVLLRRGAASVIAADVGYGQLDWRLRTDPRVHVLDRTNVRSLTPAQLGGPVELTVADLSFISLRTVLPALVGCTEGELVLLVKPQFEVGRDRVGSGGVVRDPTLRVAAIVAVAAAAADLDHGVLGVVASPLPGPAGNVEYFLRLVRGGPPLDPEQAERAVSLGPS
ncbi:MAG TPA: TlyA family RNA methyltransferase [Mycobacteriales bacterium]|nr:TlyA family RNA methyltransferase [Mycobacteriales bacterium]